MLDFKSPTVKLVKFFHKSRGDWKAKCQEAKRQNKVLANQARAVEKSRERWRQKAQSAERELQELQQQLEALKNPAYA